MCYCLFSGDTDGLQEGMSKVDKRTGEVIVDARYRFYDMQREKFATALDEAPCAEPLCCAATCCCYPIGIYYARKMTLEHLSPDTGMDNYMCCQGYNPPGMPGPCCCCCNGQDCKSVFRTDLCPHFCACGEAFCCPGCSASATRFAMMDHYTLGVHKVDVQIMQLNNCIQCLACICDIIAMFDKAFENLAHIVHCIAELVFTATVSCMVAQIHHEIKYRERGPAVAEAAPSAPMADASSPLMGEKMER